MPPTVALLTCIIFIVFLLWNDSSRSSKHSKALWVPQLWFLIILSRPVSQWLSPYGIAIRFDEGVSPLESPLDASIFIFLIFASVVILNRRKISISEICRSNVWIIFFYLYCGVSIFWSDYPYVSLKRWFKAIGNISVILIILTEFDPFDAMKTIIRRCAFILIPLSILFIKYFPELGRYYDTWSGNVLFSGASYNKNGLGCLCLVCGLFVFLNLMDGWKSSDTTETKSNFRNNLVIFIMILWALYLSNSVTSTVCLLVGLALISLFRLSFLRDHFKIMAVFLLFMVLFVYFLNHAFGIYGTFIASMGRDTSLTGRDKIWEIVLKGGSDPWIGAGYESFWLGIKIKSLMKDVLDLEFNEAHNGYLEVYLQLGYIGLCFLLALIISGYRKISRKIAENFNFGILCMVFLIVLLLYNVTEAAFKDLHPLWNLFLFMAIDYKYKTLMEDSYYGVG